MAFKSKERDEGLNIIIVGCGKVGIAILRQLCKEGHDITIVDKNQQISTMLWELWEMAQATVYRWKRELKMLIL